MDDCSTIPNDSSAAALAPDGISVLRWFTGYGVSLAVAVILLAWAAGESLRGVGSYQGVLDALAETSAPVKLLFLAVYMSLCCTFLPLPTGAVVALVALPQSSVGGGLVTTTLWVATVGAAASTVANLNDYHLFTLLLRSRGIARVRHTKLYDRAARWFARAPFGILVIFNILPIPVDISRMLATTARYPRLPFAGANFVGRFIRYALVAAVTYLLGEQYGWVSVVGLLGLAVVLGLWKVAAGAIGKSKNRKDSNHEA